jgi:hypothetical protein
MISLAKDVEQLDDNSAMKNVLNSSDPKNEVIEWNYCPGTDNSLINVKSIESETPLRIKRVVNFHLKGTIKQYDTIISIHTLAKMSFYTIID